MSGMETFQHGSQVPSNLSSKGSTMNVLKPKPVSTRQFFYSAEHRQFVGEISSTNGLGRVYDDACDEGLTLVSARTGVEVTFVVDHTERSADGELMWWLLKPVGKGPLPQVTLILLND